jgi:hypothetical protein
MCFFSGATQVQQPRHGQTEMEYLVTMDRNAQDRINVKMVNAEASVSSAIHCVNTVMEMVVV